MSCVGFRAIALDCMAVRPLCSAPGGEPNATPIESPFIQHKRAVVGTTGSRPTFDFEFERAAEVRDRIAKFKGQSVAAVKKGCRRRHAALFVCSRTGKCATISACTLQERP